MSAELKYLPNLLREMAETITELFPEECNGTCDFFETETFCKRTCEEVGCLQYKVDRLNLAAKKLKE